MKKHMCIIAIAFILAMLVDFLSDFLFERVVTIEWSVLDSVVFNGVTITICYIYLLCSSKVYDRLNKEE